MDPDRHNMAAAEPFPLPATLSEAVYFWRQVFGVWTRSTLVVHDDTNLGLIYEISPLPGDVPDGIPATQTNFAEQRREHWQKRLAALELAIDGGRTLTEDQVGLYRRVIAVTGGAEWIMGASRRVRVQQGMRERFRTGLQISGRYHPWIRKVFQEERIPEELALIPHIESSFQWQARSRVGAAGIWQLMPDTANVFSVQINNMVDERLDPILAARGAARYLKNAYRSLADWGLAVTSYNHGVEGMLRAKLEYGSDIGRIVLSYKGRNFGFASRNFYPEFLAVKQIVADLQGYFPEGVRLQPAWRGQRIALPRPMSITEIPALFQLDRGRFLEANPALISATSTESVTLPAGIEVWLPSGEANVPASKDGGPLVTQ